MAEINVVPYIDVMLVLLVIFMITAPLLTQGVKVDLPQADARPLEEEQERPLVVTVDRDGGFFLTFDDDRTQALDATELARQAEILIRRNPGAAVMVRGDRGVAYGRVVEAMVILQGANAPSIGLITEPPEG